MIVECPFCETPLESIQAAAQHAWKSQTDHPVENLDEALLATVAGIDGVAVELVDQEDYGNGGDSTVDEAATDESTEQPPTAPDGNIDGVDTGGNGTVADGGPEPLPTADVDRSEDGPTTVEDLPERYVDVDTYLATVREQSPADLDLETLEAELRKYDVVDVEATDAETLAAYTLEEVDA